VDVPLALVQLKLKGNAKGAWTLHGPASCRLSVPVQVIPGAQIQSFAGDFLAAQISGTAGASLEPKGAPQDLSTYDAATRFKIVPGSQDWRGNVVLRVQVLQSGVNGEEREVASVPVSYLVRRKEPRVYSAKVLRKGDALDPGALILRDDDTTFAQGQGFASLEELSGKRARAYIPAGKAVTADLVELPPMIRRGDIVRLLVKSGGIVIETQGRALRDARKGETLPLELADSKKQVQARCVDFGVAVREAY
jgi:flagella basal body P-ring formation protein FlgA